jgi:hypothetical protein
VHSRSALIVSVGIMVVAGYAVISALAWPLKTALFPLVISIPLFCLAAIEAFNVWRDGARSVPAKGFQRPSEEVPSGARARTLRAAGWIVGFFLAIGLFGFLVAVPLFLFAYLKLEAREGWLFSLVFTGVVWAVFYGLFDQLLHLPFGGGLLLSWLFG